MSVRGDFVTALREALKTAFDGIEFEEGIVDGRQPDRSVGCVFFERKTPFGRDGNVEQNAYVIRLFKLWKQDQGAAEPRATVHGQLLDACEELEAALAAILTSSGHWFFNVIEVAPNHQQQSVEARIVAFDQNRSARGG